MKLKFFKESLAFKLCLSMLICAFLIYLVVLCYNYFTAKELMKDIVKKNIEFHVDTLKDTIANKVNSVESVCKVLTFTINILQVSAEEEQLKEYIKELMQGNLIKYVNDLKETTSVKERIEKELSIARDIQRSILPHNFPEYKEFEIYAKLIPAREIGGDLYDFFMIDENRLCFAVGDVSGKSVSAALFMAITKTLLRAKIDTQTSLVDAVMDINKSLCKESDSSMFVTFFACILNIRTGELEYCNAGHNPPVLSLNGNKPDYLRSTEHMPPLGVMEDAEYKSYSTNLAQGDVFILYTDGITEAMNKNSEQYSEEKLLEVLTGNMNKSLPELAGRVCESIVKHADGAEQSDDITLLILKYKS